VSNSGYASNYSTQKRFKDLFGFVPNRWNRQQCYRVAAGGKGETSGKKAVTKTARGRKQDRARVAGGQDYEVKYEAKKTGRSGGAVKKAVKKIGNSRKRVEKRLGR
jgi:hypothetical protein